MDVDNDSITPDERQMRQSMLELVSISDEEIDAEWLQFITDHIPPARILELAIAAVELTEEDRTHLEFCGACHAAFERYRVAKITTDTPTEKVDRKLSGQRQLWDDEVLMSSSVDAGKTSFVQLPGPVPTLLRQHLRVASPVILPGEEVAVESWQFGRLLQISRENSKLGDQLVSFVADCMRELILQDVDKDNLMLVCFGQAMHRCATRLASQIGDNGFSSPHIVLAHDYYSPTLICDRREFRRADVLVLVDVVHQGLLLDRLMSICLSFNPNRVRGLALIDQSGGRQLCAEWRSVWREQREPRFPLDVFLSTATDEDRRKVKRFEPNEEVVVDGSMRVSGLVRASNVGGHRVISKVDWVPPSIDEELLNYIYSTRALKQDYSIGGKRYPFVVNVLDLVKKDADAKEYVLKCAEKVFADLQGRSVCLGYHVGRKARAGYIAELLSTRMNWPVVPIGSYGRTFSVTDTQKRLLASHDDVVIVDSAIRTGDTLSATVRAIEDMWLLKHVRMHAFGVLNALTKQSQLDLASELGVAIRTLFDLPLAPPTNEVRHWANAQKASILDQMSRTSGFAGVADLLGSYCASRKGGFDGGRTTLPETKKLLETAISSVVSPQAATTRIASACRDRKSQFIRHLSVDEVVQDVNVQRLLVGVMYNSMQPQFKESAAFALASASNYEWMNYEWLKCNQRFLAAKSDCWKSILVVECQMKLANREKELRQFRDAAVTLRNHVVSPSQSKQHRRTVQLSLLDEPSGISELSESLESSTPSSKERLANRLDAIISVAE